MKNKNKKFKSGCDQLHVAPLTNIDYDKLNADPTDETAFTYGNWIRVRGAKKIDLQNQFATASEAADNNANYIVQKKNNGYSGSIEVTALPPEFFTTICSMKDFIEDNEAIPVAFAVAWEYKEQGVKTRSILWCCELTQLPSKTHTTESGDLAIDSDSISILATALDGLNKIGATRTQGDKGFDAFFTKVPMPSDLKTDSEV